MYCLCMYVLTYIYLFITFHLTYITERQKKSFLQNVPIVSEAPHPLRAPEQWIPGALSPATERTGR
jgi:hypothetical protein